MKAPGNATPCNSFNANDGGGVTCENCPDPLGVCVVAVQLPQVFENAFLANLISASPLLVTELLDELL
ncbi:MAG TPA: hypothetical protein V6C85_39145 [Allocoleopsis sp.]